MKQLDITLFIILSSILIIFLILILMSYLSLVNLFLLGIFLGLKLYDKKDEKWNFWSVITLTTLLYNLIYSILVKKEALLTCFTLILIGFLIIIVINFFIKFFKK